MTVVDPPVDPEPSPAVTSGATATGGSADGSQPPRAEDGGEAVPAWRRLATAWGAELALLAVAALTYAWGLGRNGLGNPYYAASVRSMDQSWRNFAFASFDPGGWVTVDKPPLSQWAAALSVKVFGWSSWSLLLPSVVCGVASVGLLMVTVRRTWSRAAGLVAGVALAATPAVVAVSRNNNPDALLMLCCVAAAWAVSQALTASSARALRWMAVAGVCGGLAFLTKSLAVGAVLPGLWLAYLVAAAPPLRRRLLAAGVGGAAFVAVAGAWILAVQLTPLSSRPWIGGSSDGTAWDLVVGYNGLGRITGSGGPFDDLTDNPPGPGSGAGDMDGTGDMGGFMTGPDGVDEFGGEPGIGRLFNMGMGDQAMWLAPLAVVAGVAGLVVAVRARRRDARLGSLLMWLGWGGLTHLTFAYAEGIFHNYYVSLLAPATAALVGIGVQLVHEAGRLGRTVAIVALAGAAALQVELLGRVDAWEVLRWLVPIGAGAAAALAAGAVLVTLVRRRSPSARPGRLGLGLGLGALAAGLAVLGAGPVIWSLAGVRERGNPLFPDARPVSASSSASGGFGPFAGGDTGGALGDVGPPDDMVRWLREQRDGELWLVAVGSAMQAQQPIIDGDPVVALGGFMGIDGSDSVERVADAVEAGELRFVLAGGGFPGGFGGGSSAAVAAACEPVDPAVWSSPAVPEGTPASQPQAGPFGGGGDLYDCRGRAGALRDNADAEPQGDAGSPGGFPELPPGAEMEDLFEAGRCIMEHGGDPFELATGDEPSQATQDALESCEDVLPPGGFPSPGQPRPSR